MKIKCNNATHCFAQSIVSLQIIKDMLDVDESVQSYEAFLVVKNNYCTINVCVIKKGHIEKMEGEG